MPGQATSSATLAAPAHQQHATSARSAAALELLQRFTPPRAERPGSVRSCQCGRRARSLGRRAHGLDDHGLADAGTPPGVRPGCPMGGGVAGDSASRASAGWRRQLRANGVVRSRRGFDASMASSADAGGDRDWKAVLRLLGRRLRDLRQHLDEAGHEVGLEAWRGRRRRALASKPSDPWAPPAATTSFSPGARPALAMP